MTEMRCTGENLVASIGIYNKRFRTLQFSLVCLISSINFVSEQGVCKMERTTKIRHYGCQLSICCASYLVYPFPTYNCLDHTINCSAFVLSILLVHQGAIVAISEFLQIQPIAIYQTHRKMIMETNGPILSYRYAGNLEHCQSIPFFACKTSVAPLNSALK